MPVFFVFGVGLTVITIIALLFVIVFLALFVVGITTHVAIYGTKRHMATLLIVVLVIVCILEGWKHAI